MFEPPYPLTVQGLRASPDDWWFGEKIEQASTDELRRMVAWEYARESEHISELTEGIFDLLGEFQDKLSLTAVEVARLFAQTAGARPSPVDFRREDINALSDGIATLVEVIGIEHALLLFVSDFPYSPWLRAKALPEVQNIPPLAAGVSFEDKSYPIKVTSWDVLIHEVSARFVSREFNGDGGEHIFADFYDEFSRMRSYVFPESGAKVTVALMPVGKNEKENQPFRIAARLCGALLLPGEDIGGAFGMTGTLDFVECLFARESAGAGGQMAKWKGKQESLPSSFLMAVAVEAKPFRIAPNRELQPFQSILRSICGRLPQPPSALWVANARALRTMLRDLGSYRARRAGLRFTELEPIHKGAGPSASQRLKHKEWNTTFSREDLWVKSAGRAPAHYQKIFPSFKDALPQT